MVAGDKGRLELATAGLLGAQALQLGRRTFSTTDAVKSAGDQSNAKWMPARPTTTGAPQVLLDRRARVRPATTRRLEAGAIEQTAQNWLDGALGMHSKVETSNFETPRKSRFSIDWGNNAKRRAGEETK